MNAADRPLLKITGSDFKKDSNEIKNYFGLFSSSKRSLKSKGIKINAGDRFSFTITGNDAKNDSKELERVTQ